MNKQEKKKSKWLVLIIAFLLLIGVIISGIVYYHRMTKFMPSDAGAISLISGINVDEIEKDLERDFEVVDENGNWLTQTTVEIFHVTYDNETGEVSVNSSEGDRLIAPGTENSYTFKLKNTGEVAIDYEMFIDAYITPNDVKIPVEVRLNRFDGWWLVGGNDEWEEVTELDSVYDTYTVGTMCHTYYTLDWRWPFESGDDEYDTSLGNLAVGEDLVLTIEISTVATESADIYASGGVMPQTGDDNQIVLYMALAVCSIFAMCSLLYCAKEEKAC